MIRGPDVSAYQPNVLWKKVRDAGAEFSIIKVTDGNNYTNPLAKAQVLGAFAVGLLVMLYHFAQPNGKPGDLESWKADARAEAKRLDDLADEFEGALGTYPVGHPRQGEAIKLFCFLDVERNTPLTAEERPYWRAWCNEFRRWCREEGKRVIGFYSGKFFTMDLGFDSSWSQTILWVAQYPRPYREDANYGYWPKTIVPWWRGDIWQDGGGMSNAAGGNESKWPGVGDGSTFSDVNVFAGSRSELEELLQAAA